MKKNWKEIILYPAIGALVYSGLMLVIDWRRNKLDSFWLYLVCFVLFFTPMAIGKYLSYREKKKTNKDNSNL